MPKSRSKAGASKTSKPSSTASEEGGAVLHQCFLVFVWRQENKRHTVPKPKEINCCIGSCSCHCAGSRRFFEVNGPSGYSLIPKEQMEAGKDSSFSSLTCCCVLLCTFAVQKIHKLGYMEDPDALTIKFSKWVEGEGASARILSSAACFDEVCHWISSEHSHVLQIYMIKAIRSQDQWLALTRSVACISMDPWLAAHIALCLVLSN